MTSKDQSPSKRLQELIQRVLTSPELSSVVRGVAAKRGKSLRCAETDDLVQEIFLRLLELANKGSSIVEPDVLTPSMLATIASRTVAQTGRRGMAAMIRVPREQFANGTRVAVVQMSSMRVEAGPDAREDEQLTAEDMKAGYLHSANPNSGHLTPTDVIEIRDAIAALGDGDQRAVAGAVLAGMSQTTIGDLLKQQGGKPLSQPAVRRREAKTFARLQELLGVEEPNACKKKVNLSDMITMIANGESPRTIVNALRIDQGLYNSLLKLLAGQLMSKRIENISTSKVKELLGKMGKTRRVDVVKQIKGRLQKPTGQMKALARKVELV